MSDEEDEAGGIADRVELDRARGARWRKVDGGGYERISSLKMLAERGHLSAAALSGAESYRIDYLVSVEAASMRSTIYAKIGARDDEDEVMDRATTATAILGRLHREVLTEPRVRRLVAELCGRDASSSSVERAALRWDIPRQLERIAAWYEANDTRDRTERDTEAMSAVDLEGWWLLARAFNPRMSREALEQIYADSGLKEAHENQRLRAQVGTSVETRTRRHVDAIDIERRARQLFEEFAERYRQRATRWHLLSEGEKRRWRDQAEAEYERAA